MMHQEISQDLNISTNVDLILQNQQNYLIKATSENTRRAYQTAIRQFENSGGLLLGW